MDKDQILRIEPESNFNLPVNVNLADLAFCLVDILTLEQMFAFIATIDEQLADYDFTALMAEYFQHEILREDAYEPESDEDEELDNLLDSEAY